MNTQKPELQATLNTRYEHTGLTCDILFVQRAYGTHIKAKAKETAQSALVNEPISQTMWTVEHVTSVALFVPTGVHIKRRRHILRLPNSAWLSYGTVRNDIHGDSLASNSREKKNHNFCYFGAGGAHFSCLLIVAIFFFFTRCLGASFSLCFLFFAVCRRTRVLFLVAFWNRFKYSSAAQCKWHANHENVRWIHKENHVPNRTNGKSYRKK